MSELKTSSEFTIHKALLFAEEMCGLMHLSKIKDEGLLEMLGAQQLTVQASDLYHAEEEFLGRKITSVERKEIMEALGYVITPDLIGHKCLAFSVAHMLFHILGDDDFEH